MKNYWTKSKVDKLSSMWARGVPAREIANKIATGPNLIYSSIKEVMRKTENIDEQPAFDILRSLDSVKKVYNSEDLSEGASSFVKKEKPKWKDK